MADYDGELSIDGEPSDKVKHFFDCMKNRELLPAGYEYTDSPMFLGPNEADQYIVDNDYADLWVLAARVMDGWFLVHKEHTHGIEPVEGLQWLIDNVFKPDGLTLDGDLYWEGDDFGDGVIKVAHNKVIVGYAKLVYYTDNGEVVNV